MGPWRELPMWRDGVLCAAVRQQFESEYQVGCVGPRNEARDCQNLLLDPGWPSVLIKQNTIHTSSALSRLERRTPSLQPYIPCTRLAIRANIRIVLLLSTHGTTQLLSLPPILPAQPDFSAYCTILRIFHHFQKPSGSYTSGRSQSCRPLV